MGKTIKHNPGSRKSTWIGDSEIRPISAPAATNGSKNGRSRNGSITFAPGGSYDAGKFPELERTIESWRDMK